MRGHFAGGATDGKSQPMNVIVFLDWDVPVFVPAQEQFVRFREGVRARGGEARLARTEEEFLGLLPAATHVIAWTFRQEWFGLAPRLREVSTPAAGRDYFHVVPPDGVAMGYGSFHGAIMGETAAAAVLALSHGLLLPPGGGAAWPRAEFAARARRIAGSTVVILGFGAIGRAAGAFLKPFGPRIVGVSRAVHPAPDWFAPGDECIATSDLDSVLPEADFLVCFLPSGPGTDRLLGAKRFAAMKRSAFVLNFGRGNCIDENALSDALRAGSPAGAVLDVFREEPLPEDSPLRTAPNCVLLPHASAFSPDYLDLFFSEWLTRH